MKRRSLFLQRYFGYRHQQIQLQKENVYSTDKFFFELFQNREQIPNSLAKNPVSLSCS